MTLRYDVLSVEVHDSAAELGRHAAEHLAEILKQAAAEDEAAIILATGNSQIAFLDELVQIPEVPWGRISIFHMDEYVGIPDTHPASFRRYIRERVVERVRPKAFFGVDGDAADLEQEVRRYTALLREHRPVACALGIGENGHLAFNDPPADFDCPYDVTRVKLAEASRRQQVGEGHFASIEDVPSEALTLTIPALLRPAHVLAVVPEGRKARAVRDALTGPVTTDCPASVLRRHQHVRLFLDRDSASLLPG